MFLAASKLQPYSLLGEHSAETRVVDRIKARVHAERLPNTPETLGSLGDVEAPDKQFAVRGHRQSTPQLNFIPNQNGTVLLHASHDLIPVDLEISNSHRVGCRISNEVVR